MRFKPQKPVWIVGIDEVGRGPLSGHVFVSGCAIKESDYRKIIWTGLNDSKKMTVMSREKWFDIAKKMENKKIVKISISSRSAKFIDLKGINKSIMLCIEDIFFDLNLNPKKCQIFLDGGLSAPNIYPNQKTIIKGDQKKKIISLASVVAKVSRDKIMIKISKKYPNYFWEKNKGYGTKDHINAIKKYGITKEHRKTYLSRIIDKN